jgi:hypothetical protein
MRDRTRVSNGVGSVNGGRECYTPITRLFRDSGQCVMRATSSSAAAFDRGRACVRVRACVCAWPPLPPRPHHALARCSMLARACTRAPQRRQGQGRLQRRSSLLADISRGKGWGMCFGCLGVCPGGKTRALPRVTRAVASRAGLLGCLLRWWFRVGAHQGQMCRGCRGGPHKLGGAGPLGAQRSCGAGRAERRGVWYKAGARGGHAGAAAQVPADPVGVRHRRAAGCTSVGGPLTPWAGARPTGGAPASARGGSATPARSRRRGDGGRSARVWAQRVLLHGEALQHMLAVRPSPLQAGLHLHPRFKAAPPPDCPRGGDAPGRRRGAWAGPAASS